MEAGSTPQAGDIVVRQYARDGTSMFALLTAPGPEQTVLSTLDAALGQARAFAKRQRVRVWMEHGDAEFTLVDDFRVGVAAL